MLIHVIEGRNNVKLKWWCDHTKRAWGRLISIFGEWKYQQISWPQGHVKNILLTGIDINDSVFLPYQNKNVYYYFNQLKKMTSTSLSFST